MEEIAVKKLLENKKEDRKELLKILYNKLSEKMFILIYRYVRNEYDAEDILNNGFIKVFEHIYSFEYRGYGSIEAWIKKIMINEALMFLRKRHDFNIISESSILNIQHNISADSRIEEEEYYKILQQLPVGYRTVFNLYAIEGYSHAEIADKLNIKESTSRSQLTKARDMLRKLLTKYGL